MIHPEYFGNPNNPFDENSKHPELILWGNPVRALASQQIKYMLGFQDMISHSIAPDGTQIRTVELEAVAPFHKEGIFLNGKEPAELEEKDATWEEIILTLEDKRTETNTVSERSITLARPKSKLFGVAGISTKGTIIRNLVSLTTRLSGLPEPHAELWAKIEETNRLIAQGTSPFTESVDFHLIALSRTLASKLHKARLLKGEDGTKYRFSDY